MSSPLPLKESSRGLIIEVVKALEPYYPDVTVHWREKVGDLGVDGRATMALERLTIAIGCTYIIRGDFEGFFENLAYFGTRLAKLQIDTRIVARALELYQNLCEPYVCSLFGERQSEAIAALEMVRSATFVTVSGAYFDSKTRETSALLSVLDAELATGTLKEMLQLVLDITCAHFRASVGAILLRSADSEVLNVEAARGFEGVTSAGVAEIQFGQGIAGNIALTGEPAMVIDTASDHRIVNAELRERARSVWGAPMKSAGEILGVLLIGFSKPFEWMPTERDLLRAIADRASLSIDRARMTDALRERETKIADLSGHLLAAQEDERNRISRELHDETGQALMVIRLYLGMLDSVLTARTAKEKIRETVAVVDRTIEGLRRIIGRLSPLVLQELGLIAAIRKEAKDLAKNTGVKARVEVAENMGRVAPDIETALYRVVQEALHNVAKHAQAQTVVIELGREQDLVHLAVEDDGIGFATKQKTSGHSFGIAGIKERVSSLGGSVRIRSAKGKGTRIEVNVPVSHGNAMLQSA